MSIIMESQVPISRRDEMTNDQTSNIKHQTLAFTLIELLVVIAIIGVLAVLIIANMNAVRERARDAQRKSDLKNIKTSLMIYYNACGSYPDEDGQKIKGCGGDTASCSTASACDWGNPWSMGGTTYMKLLPQDPLNDTDHVYIYTRSLTDPNSFTLVANLENMADQAGPTSRTQCGYTHVDGKNEYVVCED